MLLWFDSVLAGVSLMDYSPLTRSKHCTGSDSEPPTTPSDTAVSIAMSNSRKFAAYVPNLVLRRLQCNPSIPENGEGRCFPAVALFADIAGSTKLANQLARLGRQVGPEEMFSILNLYYHQLIALISGRGGDIVGFAGDAVMAVWPADDSEGLGPPVQQATQSAIEIQEILNNMELAEGIRLSLRICIGAGELSTALVGGTQGYWQLVAYGPPMDQIRAAGDSVRIGEVYLSHAARRHLGAGASLEPLPDGGAVVRRLGAIPPRPDPVDLLEADIPESALRPFIPRAVQESIDAGVSDFLDQFRTVSSLFVRVIRPPGSEPRWERMQAAMAVLQDAMARYEGTVVQLMEDDKGLIAVLGFGLPPVAHEDDAARAVEAAVYLRGLARERGVACGIGISTGLPFCGPLGSEDRRVYTVTGADVIRAARLMQAAHDGEIRCDHATRAAAGKAAARRFTRLPRFMLKGFDSPVPVFLVAAPTRDVSLTGSGEAAPSDDESLIRAAARRLRAERLGPRLEAMLRDAAKGGAASVERECERLLAEDRLVIEGGVCKVTEPVAAPAAIEASPLIGRDTEREVVSRFIGGVAAGTSRVLLVEGEIGIGKSRLLEAARDLAEERGIRGLVVHCSSVEAATPYFPWRAVFDELLALSTTSEPAERGTEVVRVLQSRPQFLPLAPLLNDLLGLDLPEDEIVRQMSGQTRADNLQDVLIGLFEAAIAGRPTLIAFDDAHWADASSWRLADLIRERIGGIALALAIRPGDVPLAAEYARFTEADGTGRIVLDTLPAAQARELARLRLGAVRVADPLAELIWQRTRGSPLFIEQVVEHMRAAGLVELREGVAVLRAASEAGGELSLPDSVHGLITARIDRLPPAPQVTAKVASVIGPQFPGRALAAVHPDPAAAAILPDHVDRLIRERVLREERPAPDSLYDFPHPIVQEVCYGLLPRPQRQRLHQRAAEWFESEQAAAERHFRVIAYHWGRAGSREKQADFLNRAGDAALRDGAFREAVTGFTELLQLSRERFRNIVPPHELDRRAHWEFQLGQAHLGVGDLPAAVKHLRASLALRGRPCRTSRAGQVVDCLAQLLRQFTRRLRPFRRLSGDAEMREAAAAFLRLARISYFMNDALTGTNALLRGLNLAELVGPSPQLATAYASTTILCGLMRWHRAARLYARLAESVTRETGQISNTAMVLGYLAMYELAQGNWERADALGRECLGLAERIGDHQLCGDGATVLAMLGCFRADYGGAGRWADRILEAAGRSGNNLHMAWGLNIAGECDLRLGRFEEAAVKLKESARALEGRKDRTEEIRIEGMLAALAVRSGRLEEASRHADAAEAVARETSAVTCSCLEGLAGVAEVRLAQAEAGPGIGQAVRAARFAVAVLRKYARVFPIGRPRAALFEGRLQLLMQRGTRAVRSWQKGLNEAMRLQMPLEEALLHAALARPPAPESYRHRAAAVRLFEQLGMPFEAERLKRQ
jgi:class 3 adenylate cyclase/tetratricopeptide (TPR) repeat protein